MRILTIVLALLLGGCASYGGGGGGNVIGTLRVSGPSVFLDSKPGRDGDQVFIGSTLTTGAASSAIVDFEGGGYLQLDENTDPVFGWIAQSKCILIRIVRGQAYLKRERACVEGPDISMVLNSEANLRFVPEPRLSEVTLVRGSAQVTAPGGPVTLQPGQQLAVTGGRAPALRVLTRGELKAVSAWRRGYRFRPAAGPDIEVFPTPVPHRPDHRRESPATTPPPTESPGTSDGPPPTPPPTPPTTTPTTPGVDRGIRVPVDTLIRPPTPPPPDIR